MKTMQLVKVYALICLYALVFIAELVANQFSHSLTLLVDSYYNLYTVLSLLLLVISFKVPFQVTLYIVITLILDCS